jgi:hypothetical protein
MFTHDPVEFPRLKQCNLPIGRVYQIESGQHAGAVYPSITRILAASPKPQLEAWKQRVGPEEAKRVVSRAGIRGASIHRLAENYLGNNPLPEVMPNITGMWRFLAPWLETNITRVVAQEQDVYSHRLKVAGRMDLLADVTQLLSIVDVKSAERFKREAWVRDYFLQVTFYGCAVYELTGLRVKKLVLPIVSPEGLQVFECGPLDHFDELKTRIDGFYQTFNPATNSFAGKYAV